jgi:hypothetical protein
MSTNLTALADLQADLAALSAEVQELRATQPNLAHFADELGAHLVRFEASVTSTFTDKFAGNLFRATEAWTGRLMNVEDTQTRLEGKLDDHLTKYVEMIEAHRKKVAKMLEGHEKSVKALLDGNGEQLAAQQAVINRLHTYLAGFDKHFVDLHNSAVALADSSEQTIDRVDAAVEKFEAISTGTLEEVAKRAKETISLASSTAKLEMEKIVADNKMHTEATRKHYRRVLSGFDNKFAEHPLLVMSCFVFIIALASGLIGVWAGRIGQAQHTQKLVDDAVDSAAQKVEERMQRIEEQTKSLSTTFEYAQYWEALTDNMSYDQKMAYIKLAQQQAQRQGRKLGLPKSMQEDKK